MEDSANPAHAAPGQNGVVIVDKPRGPTSHDVVARARRLFGTRAIGHAGTLDPMASGVLVVLLGEATKLSGWLTLADKRYRATLRLGADSDSLDADGQITEHPPLPAPTPAALEAALADERARVSQIPPAVSAVQVAGKRAYELTRAGQAPVLEPRQVSVRSLDLIAADGHHVSLEICVSKGYYVRALARDLASRLGTVGYLTELRRLASGPFSVERAVAWPATEPPALLNVSDAARLCLPAAHLTNIGAERAGCGKPLDETCFDAPPPDHPLEPSAAQPPVAWYYQGRLLALGRASQDGFRVVRGFNPKLTGVLSDQDRT